jgi:hypothetical protein
MVCNLRRPGKKWASAIIAGAALVKTGPLPEGRSAPGLLRWQCLGQCRWLTGGPRGETKAGSADQILPPIEGVLGVSGRPGGTVGSVQPDTLQPNDVLRFDTEKVVPGGLQMGDLQPLLSPTQPKNEGPRRSQSVVSNAVLL